MGVGQCLMLIGRSGCLNFESRAQFHGRATSSSRHRIIENGDAAPPGDQGKNRAHGISGFSPLHMDAMVLTVYSQSSLLSTLSIHNKLLLLLLVLC